MLMNKIAIVLSCLLGLAVIVGAQTKDLQVYFNDRPPLYIVKGETGFLAEITKLVLKEAKIPFKFVNYPSNRILETIKEGKEYGVGLGWFKNADRETWANFSKPIYKDNPQVIIANKTKASVIGAKPTMENLLKSGLVLGFKEGYSFGAVIDGLVKANNPKMLTSPEEVPKILKMINIGRMDYTIFGKEEASYLITNDPELTDLVIIPIADAPDGNQRYFMYSKAVDKPTIDRINNAIDKVLASQEYKKLTTF